MSFRATGFYRATAILLCILSGSCAHRGAPARPPRLAILRFENLGADPSLDWMGRAFEEVLSTDLSRAHDVTVIHAARVHSLDKALGPRPVAAPGISAERQSAIGAGARLVGYGTYSVAGGRLYARLAIEDIDTRRMVHVLSASGAPGDAIGVAARLAAGITSQTTVFATRSVEALRDYSEAMETGDFAKARPLLEQAIASDADYGPAYRMLAQLQLQQQDRGGSIATLERGLARGASLSAVERARLAADLAGLQNAPDLKLRALAALVKLDPNDITAWQSLGALAMSRRQFAQSVAAYRALVEREPEDFNSWNTLAYASAYTGDYAAARDAARHYGALRPAEVNPLDSLGDVNLMCSHFHEAEEAYLLAAKKDPNFRNNGEFFKAAMARLWTGDIAGANALAERYRQARAAAHDPLVGLRQIEWIWLTGRRKDACRQMEAFARGSLNDVAPRAWEELAVWELLLGDRTAAQRASEAIGGPGANSTAGLIIRFLLQPPAPAEEWTERAAEAFPNPQQSAMRSVALTAALLLAGDFQPASDVLRRSMEAGTPQLEETAPVLLAWTYLETNRAAAAEPLLKVTPVPSFNGADAFLGFSFPRLCYLRGEEAAKRGQASEARADYRVFLQLSGPDPLRWGEEAKAKAGL